MKIIFRYAILSLILATSCDEKKVFKLEEDVITSIRKNNNCLMLLDEGFGVNQDTIDELSGYKRQGLFGNNGGISKLSNLPDNYSSLPTGPVNIHNLNPAVNNVVKTNNRFQLQALANQRNQAFRVNNKTYIPKTKK